jgi:hypothetical protein
VAIAAIDAIITDMVLMAELNRLRFDDLGLIPIGRPWKAEKDEVNRNSHDAARSHERCARYRVRALLK